MSPSIAALGRLVALAALAAPGLAGGAPSAARGPSGGSSAAAPAASQAASERPPGPRGDPSAGARLFLAGVDGAGRPLRAVVSGDVPLLGGAAACASCHLRSGIGSVEGGVVAARLTGPVLFAPRPSHPSARPAYDEASLARALREGVDPAGRRLSAVMPRYTIEQAEVVALARFLRGLGAAPAPGVTAEAIRFATILTPDAPPAARAATLAVLGRAVERHNARTRLQGTRHWRDEERAWRQWELDVWELTGPPAAWPEQLSRKLAAAPPFAVVSGAGGEWGPVRAFCEEQGLPCLLPNVDAPPEGEAAYTVAWGGGVEVEVRALAAALAERSGPVLQVVRGAAARSAGVRLGRLLGEGRSRLLEPAAPLDPAAVAARVASGRASEVVLWLPAAEAGPVAAALPPGVTVYLSASTLGEEPAAVPGLAGRRLVVARPWAPLGEALPKLDRLRGWLGPAARGASRGLRYEDQTFFAAMLLGETLMHLDGVYQRDALLDLLDHTAGLEAWSAYWPRLSFGAGQRRLSQGCWLVERSADGREVARWTSR